MSTTWDPTHWHSQMVLSNGNLTATASSGFSVCGVAAHPITQKSYFEFRLDVTDGNGQVAVGVAVQGVNTNNYLGAEANSFGYWPGDNGLYNNGSKIATPGESKVVSTIRVCVDPVAGKIWFGINSGYWNNDSNQSPTLGLGGYDISSLSGSDIYPAMSVTRTGEQATARFASSSWQYFPPSGFGEINVQTPVSATATQTLRMNAPATGQLERRASASNTLQMATDSTGKLYITGKTLLTQVLRMASDSVGKVLNESFGTANQTLSMGQSATAKLPIKGVAGTQAVSWLWMWTTATAKVSPNINASASQSLSMGQTTQGKLVVQGVADQSFQLQQNAEAKKNTNASVASTFTLLQTSVGDLGQVPARVSNTFGLQQQVYGNLRDYNPWQYPADPNGAWMMG